MSEETKKTEVSKVNKAIANKPDTKDIEDNKVYAILAYIGILCLVPILAAKDSKFAQFHANQGLVLFICGIAGSIFARIPIFGWIIYPVVSIGIIVLAIMGIVSASKGEMKELPIIGSIKILK
jgi:uncharacterized membrane protein